MVIDRAMDIQKAGGGLTWSKGEWDIAIDRAMDRQTDRQTDGV